MNGVLEEDHLFLLKQLATSGIPGMRKASRMAASRGKTKGLMLAVRSWMLARRL